MKRWMIGLLVMFVGCTSVSPAPTDVAEEDVVARSTGPRGGFAVWQDGDDFVLGYMEQYGDEGKRLCSLKQGKCPRWDEGDYSSLSQRDLGPSWWASSGKPPLVAWVPKYDHRPVLTVADFSTGASAQLPYVRKVWSSNGRLFVAHDNTTTVISQGTDELIAHAALIPCMGERFCFEVGPRFDGGLDDPLPPNWRDASHQYDLPAGRVEALVGPGAARLLVSGLGGMTAPIGSRCISNRGHDVLTCGAADETTVAMLRPGLPSTTVDFRGITLRAGGEYWFANTETINKLEPNGDLLALGRPLPFHSGYAQLAGDCAPSVREAIYERASRCLARSPINAVYATADVSTDGMVDVDAAPLDPVGRACMREIVAQELSDASCRGTVAFRFFGTGMASAP